MRRTTVIYAPTGVLSEYSFELDGGNERFNLLQTPDPMALGDWTKPFAIGGLFWMPNPIVAGSFISNYDGNGVYFGVQADGGFQAQINVSSSNRILCSSPAGTIVPGWNYFIQGYAAVERFSADNIVFYANGSEFVPTYVNNNLNTNYPTRAWRLGSNTPTAGFLATRFNHGFVLDNVPTLEEHQEAYNNGKPKNPLAVYSGVANFWRAKKGVWDGTKWVLPCEITGINANSQNMIEADRIINSPY